MSTDSEVANLIASKFIARPDVKAIQREDGSWKPHTHNGKVNGDKLPWRRSDLLAHLAGEQTFGHYLLSESSECKLFAFDIDLNENRRPEHKDGEFTGTWISEDDGLHEFDAREAWRNRAHPSRGFVKVNMMLLAASLAHIMVDDLQIPTAVAYSGGKGVHVYGFVGKMEASEVREGAKIVLDTLAEFAPSRGDNFYQAIDQDPRNGFRNFTIEVFPKQDTINEGGLGNLMRLPLGRNLKNPKDQTFFLDMRAEMGTMLPIAPAVALNSPNPWKPADA